MVQLNNMEQLSDPMVIWAAQMERYRIKLIDQLVKLTDVARSELIKLELSELETRFKELGVAVEK